MEEQYNKSNRPVNPRRKQRSQMQIIKETYLPVIILGIAVILIIIFIIGSIARGAQKRKAEVAASIAESSSIAEEQARVELEIQNMIAQAEAKAAEYD